MKVLLIIIAILVILLIISNLIWCIMFLTQKNIIDSKNYKIKELEEGLNLTQQSYKDIKSEAENSKKIIEEYQGKIEKIKQASEVAKNKPSDVKHKEYLPIWNSLNILY